MQGTESKPCASTMEVGRRGLLLDRLSEQYYNTHRYYLISLEGGNAMSIHLAQTTDVLHNAALLTGSGEVCRPA
jgi:hypothetical protein